MDMGQESWWMNVKRQDEGVDMCMMMRRHVEYCATSYVDMEKNDLHAGCSAMMAIKQAGLLKTEEQSVSLSCLSHPALP